MRFTSDQSEVSAVILTGGNGSRFREGDGEKLPKQFAAAGGRPVFVHALELYLNVEEVDKIYLVVNESYRHLYEAILERYGYSGTVTIVPGGQTRLRSVTNAIAHVPESGLTVVHNGASILTDRDYIRRCIREADKRGAVTGWMKPLHTVFERSGDSVKRVLERSRLGYTCDPQVFSNGIIREATAASSDFFDDAPVVDLVLRAGYPVYLVESGYENLKITTETDLLCVESILSDRHAKEGEHAETVV